MPAFVLQITRVGFLLLLWLFVYAAIRTIRADIRVLATSEPRDSRRARRERAVAAQLDRAALHRRQVALGVQQLQVARAAGVVQLLRQVGRAPRRAGPSVCGRTARAAARRAR